MSHNQMVFGNLTVTHFLIEIRKGNKKLPLPLVETSSRFNWEVSGFGIYFQVTVIEQNLKLKSCKRIIEKLVVICVGFGPKRKNVHGGIRKKVCKKWPIHKWFMN